MGVDLAKDSIDLGIVTNNQEAMVAFYRDVLGFEDAGTMPVPGGTMHRLICGTSAIKLVQMNKPREVVAPPGGMGGATGYRYWTMAVNNLEDVLAACEQSGAKVAVPLTEFRPGVTIAIVEDPDGNWVEFGQGL